jgi:tetratricopeptide (TPR) repeat protein
LGLKEYRATGSSAGAADFLSLARACTTHLPKDDSRRLQLASIAATRLQSIVDDPEAPLSMDDRGEAMRILRNFHLDGQDDKAARAIAERQRILLDQAARDASSPMMAMTYNWPRAEVYAFLDRAKELVPVFERSEKDLPNQYDPPYRLAWIYHKIGQHDLALAAAKRALEKAYGPRKGRVLSLIAAVHREREDLEAEIAARRAVVALYEGLPPGHEHAGRLEKARKTLQELVGE